jgi:hypothetical protein
MSYARYKTGGYTNYGIIVGDGGIFFSGAYSKLVNVGSIFGTTAVAVRLSNGGSVDNQGRILGFTDGVLADQSATIFNSNYLRGFSDGVDLKAGGVIFNEGFLAGNDGLQSFGNTTFFNLANGVVGGSFAGLGLVSGGGTVANYSYGEISGGVIGVYALGAPAYITNHYLIRGGSLYGGTGIGVELDAGGTITNEGSYYLSEIYGGKTGVFGYAGAVSTFVTNYSQIKGGTVAGGAGVYLKGNVYFGTAAGDVLNKAGGTIAGYQGIRIAYGGYVRNGGSILGLGSAGVTMTGSGYVVNDASGVIEGSTYGVAISGFSGVVHNYGTISGQTAIVAHSLATVDNFGGTINGTASTGVSLRDGGVVFNGNTAGHVGTISGGYYGVLVQGNSAYVENQGVIKSFYTAVEVLAGGTVTNSANGLINGYGGSPGRGVLIEGPSGVVINSGSINGAGYFGVQLALSGGGYVRNKSGATISGGLDGVHANGAAVQVKNSGVITGGNDGVYLQNGNVTNTTGARVSGGVDGVQLIAAGTVINPGTISGATGAGVALGAGGFVQNQAAGSIVGKTDGVLASGAAANVSNTGFIGASSGNGVYLGAGGQVTNAAGARISASSSGVVLKTAGNVVNSGSISGAGADGVLLKAGGILVNKATGTISGGNDGILVSHGNATITTAGHISGPNFAVRFIGNGTDTLIVDPGATFSGVVGGGGAVSTLVLASAASAGSVSGLGSEFSGFASAIVASGATWTATGLNSLASTTKLSVAGLLKVSGSLTTAGPVTVSGALRSTGTGHVQLRDNLSMTAGSTIADVSTSKFEIGTKGGAANGVVTVDAGATLTGAGTVASPVVDKGSIVAKGGTLAFTGTVSGTGTLSMASHASASIAGALSVSKLTFLAGGHETAALGKPTSVTSTISGFTLTSDVIDLKGFVANKLSFAGHTLTVDRSGGTAAHLLFAGTYHTSNFTFASDGHGGTNIKFV